MSFQDCDQLLVNQGPFFFMFGSSRLLTCSPSQCIKSDKYYNYKQIKNYIESYLFVLIILFNLFIIKMFLTKNLSSILRNFYFKILFLSKSTFIVPSFLHLFQKNPNKPWFGKAHLGLTRRDVACTHDWLEVPTCSLSCMHAT